SQAEMLTQQEEESQALEAQVAELSAQLENQAAQMASLQEQMSNVMASVQLNQSKMNNCCGTAPQEKRNSESGKVELEQNFPNPFDTETTIQFAISEPAQIRLEISDNQGRVLDVLVNQRMEKGDYTERWDSSSVTPGTYYYSLYADTELLTKKMIKK
ncbi:MAG: T9SS type A sorting domain-containing protein, partial [Bacteroidota bacterium]